MEALRRSRDDLGGVWEEARYLREGLDDAKALGVEMSARAAEAESLAEEQRWEESNIVNIIIILAGACTCTADAKYLYYNCNT